MADICNVLDNGHALPAWSVERPGSAAELAQIVSSSLKDGLGLSTADPALLAPYLDRKSVFLDLSCLDKVREHVASDLVIGVECGIALDRLHSLLAERGQIFASSSPGRLLADLLRLGDGGPGESGYGYLRSNVLGFEYFDASGALIKCGGRVVKNVTGYDTTKLLVGTSAFGLPYSTYLRLFALPQKTVTLTVSARDSDALLGLSHQLIISALPFSCLEIIENESGDGYLLVLVFEGAESMVDDLQSAAVKLGQTRGVSLTLSENHSWPLEHKNRVELACSQALLGRMVTGLSLVPRSERGRVLIRPGQGRLTIDCTAEILQQTCHHIKNLLLADLSEHKDKQAMESYSYTVRVDGVMLDCVELTDSGKQRAALTERLLQSVGASSYHPYRRGLFV